MPLPLKPDIDSPLVARGNWVPSPNYGPRLGERGIDILLLHYTSTPTTNYALELLTSEEAGVSSHYLIDGEGEILQLVSEGERAWHAGEAVWAGERDINSCSIGIEIQNPGAAMVHPPPYGRRQMASVIALSKDIIRRHGIPACRVLGHSDVAPHRKQDPGGQFDWRRLAKEGVGVFIEAPELAPGEALALSPDDIKNLQAMLVEIGYGLDVNGFYDERMRLVITAFQRHYRAVRVDGKVDLQTVRLIELLRGALCADALSV